MVIAHIGNNTNDQTCNGGGHCGIDALGQNAHICLPAAGGELVEGYYHPDYRSQKSKHGDCTCNRGEYAHVLLQFVNFKSSGIFNSAANGIKGASNSGNSFFGESRNGGIMLCAQQFRSL